jgi:hypothetical protein
LIRFRVQLLGFDSSIFSILGGSGFRAIASPGLFTAVTARQIEREDTTLVS